MTNAKKLFPLVFAALSSLLPAQTTIHDRRSFPTLTFDELVTLSKDKPLSEPLAARLDKVLHAIELDNSKSESAPVLDVPRIGPAIRAAQWNIERGENFDWLVLALNGEKEFRANLEKENPSIDPVALNSATEEAKLLHDASILVLNELDMGMQRSNYHDVARELADTLKMNYAFGVSFVEVDPLKVGTEELTLEDTGGDEELLRELMAELKGDPERYKGLHGAAILSRYPISNVHMLRLPECYDWFGRELENVRALEAGKRLASRAIFMAKIEREVRRGGRIAIIADLTVPEVPGGKVTVVNVHLENKCPPACRQVQIQAVLDAIKDVHHPVILAGDMNTTGSDGTKLTAGHVVQSRMTDYRFWARQVVTFGTPIPSFTLFNHFKNYSDPTARDIRVFANNREAGFFSRVQNYRFADQSRFDFRGERNWTVNGTRKRLANSNMRDTGKGFVYTFSLPRYFRGLFGRMKLDWVFIKPYYDDGRSTDRVIPVFSRTMRSVNIAPPERISDHSPITVDLPIENPRRKGS